MNRTFSIFVAAALLLGSSSAEAARGTAGSNSSCSRPNRRSAQLHSCLRPIRSGAWTRALALCQAFLRPIRSGARALARTLGRCQAIQDHPVTTPMPRCSRSTIRLGHRLRHNYAKHQHWRNYYPRRVHGLKRAANFSEPMLDLAAGW